MVRQRSGAKSKKEMIGGSVNARSGERVEFAMSRMGFCAVIKGVLRTMFTWT